MVEKRVIGTLNGADVHEFTVSDGDLPLILWNTARRYIISFLRVLTVLRDTTILRDM